MWCVCGLLSVVKLLSCFRCSSPAGRIGPRRAGHQCPEARQKDMWCVHAAYGLSFQYVEAVDSDPRFRRRRFRFLLDHSYSF